MNIDLNGDTLVDVADALRFRQYFHTFLTGLTAEEAFSRGDMNGDSLSNHADFRLFKVAYNQHLGEGAFEAAWTVPEPAGMMLAFVAAASLVAASPKRRRLA